MPRAVAQSRAARGETRWWAQGVPRALRAASMASLGHPLPGSVWELWVRNQCHSAQCQTQLLSPARLQTLHQCCSIDVLTYQTS